MRTFEVYALHCECTECEPTPRYVGCTRIGTAHRLKQHFGQTAAMKFDYPVNRWIRAHAAENIKATVLQVFESADDMKLGEIAWIAELGTFAGLRQGGLNLTLGGDGSDWGKTRSLVDAEFAERYRAIKIKGGQIGGKTAGKIGAATVARRRAEDPEYDAAFRAACAKGDKSAGGRATARRLQDDLEYRERMRRMSVESASRMNEILESQPASSPEFRSRRHEIAVKSGKVNGSHMGKTRAKNLRMQASSDPRFASKLEEASSLAGKIGSRVTNHKRWHVGRGVVVEECEHCNKSVCLSCGRSFDDVGESETHSGFCTQCERSI